MEAEALHNFSPSDEVSELAFRKGDKLLILDYGDQIEWYSAQKDGRIGLVPGNYIEVKRVDWYMGRISRAKAEHILQATPEGGFVVRLSESSPNDFSLSVKCGKDVQHFRILRDDDHKFYLWQTKFNSLNELVEYYRHESVSRNSKVFLRAMNMPNGAFIAEALYKFEPQEEEGETAELGFEKGDLITVVDDGDENWWGGSIGTRQGFFPKTYVKRRDDLTPFGG